MAFNTQNKRHYLFKPWQFFLKLRLEARYKHFYLALTVAYRSIYLLGGHCKSAISAILLVENPGVMRWFFLALAWLFQGFLGGRSRKFAVNLIRELCGNRSFAAAKQ
jgi:hypothetical protein